MTINNEHGISQEYLAHKLKQTEDPLLGIIDQVIATITVNHNFNENQLMDVRMAAFELAPHMYQGYDKTDTERVIRQILERNNLPTNSGKKSIRNVVLAISNRLWQIDEGSQLLQKRGRPVRNPSINPEPTTVNIEGYSIYKD